MRKLLPILATLLALALPWAVQAGEDAAPAVEVPIGEDGLHKPDWLRFTFKDLREDLNEAKAQNKRLLLLWEQRGCIYCKKMHTEVFPRPEILQKLRNEYFVVQYNLFGDEEVTDFDGTVLPEKEMARRWGVLFTPTMMFMPDEDPGQTTAGKAAVATMPGAFGPLTTYNLLEWVRIKGYETGEHFQKYHARMIAKRRAEQAAQGN